MLLLFLTHVVPIHRKPPPAEHRPLCCKATHRGALRESHSTRQHWGPSPGHPPTQQPLPTSKSEPALQQQLCLKHEPRPHRGRGHAPNPWCRAAPHSIHSKQKLQQLSASTTTLFLLPRTMPPLPPCPAEWTCVHWDSWFHWDFGGVCNRNAVLMADGGSERGRPCCLLCTWDFSSCRGGAH